jgi:hypothetical protein
MDENEVKKRIDEAVVKARQHQLIMDMGEVFLKEALGHTAPMVNRGEFKMEAHQFGQLCLQYLPQVVDLLLVLTVPPEKPEEKPPE